MLMMMMLSHLNRTTSALPFTIQQRGSYHRHGIVIAAAEAIRSRMISRPQSSSNAASSTSLSSSLSVEQHRNVLSITLDRPKALNTLTLETCNSMIDLLRDINRGPAVTRLVSSEESHVGLFILKGSGSKAFCAGGDVKSIWQELYGPSAATAVGSWQDRARLATRGILATEFFLKEYQMNYMLSRSAVPQLSLWDGIVMGGGVGISIYGDFRVATEKTVFAMPETAIGLIPDIGGGWWLPRLADGVGLYLGMTGSRLNATDLMQTGIATHFFPSDRLEELQRVLRDTDIPRDAMEARKVVRGVLDVLQAGHGGWHDETRSEVAKHGVLIRRCFHEASSADDVLQRLSDELVGMVDDSNRNDDDTAGDNSGSIEWVQRTMDALKKCSPMSLQLTYEQLRRGASMDLKQCLSMEFGIMMHCIHAPDFREGVRALLVDKDNEPRWQHLPLSEQQQQAYFEPLGSKSGLTLDELEE